MKKIILMISVCIMSVFMGIPSDAALVDNGDGTVIDTDYGLMWLKDANAAGVSMDWNEAVSWADSLTFAGYSDWRLPDAHDPGDPGNPCAGYDCTESELGHLYYTYLGNSAGGPLTNTGPFENIQSYYWYKTERWELPSQAWEFDFSTGYQYPYSKTYKDHAWAVRDCPSCATIIPEPVSSILFIVGGLTLGTMRFGRAKAK